MLCLVVVVDHSMTAAGLPHLPQLGEASLGLWSVAGFFALSGYLIFASAERGGFVSFLWRRVLRIFPAFWLCLLLTAFVLAPMVAALLGNPWHPVEAARYVLGNAGLVITQHQVGDSLSGAPYDQLWNVSLWTLQYEFAAYLLTALLVMVLPARWRSWLCFGAVAAAAVLLPQAGRIAALVGGGPVLKVTIGNVLFLAAFYAAGVLMRLWGDRLRLTWPLALTALALVVLAARAGSFLVLGALPFAYLLLFLGGRTDVPLGRRNDLSYGIYVYGFPMTHLLVALGAHRWAEGDLGRALFALLAVLAVLPVAWASWQWVERPALALGGRRTRGPGPKNPGSTSVEPATAQTAEEPR